MAALDFPVNIGDTPTFRFNMKNQAGAIFPVGGVTTQEALFTKPDGSKLAKPTVFLTDGSDGVIEYTTEDNTIIDQAGTWKRQPHVVFSPTVEFYGEVKVFDVDENQA